MATLLHRLGKTAYRRWPVFLLAWLVAFVAIYRIVATQTRGAVVGTDRVAVLYRGWMPEIGPTRTSLVTLDDRPMTCRSGNSERRSSSASVQPALP